jgi:hypothetical protein
VDDGLRRTRVVVEQYDGDGWTGTDLTFKHYGAVASRDVLVREVFVIHVGGTRYVTSSTGNIMKIRARITLTVEFIRTCLFLF